MAYRLEGKDIVISGFEEGIADNPYQGIADMRNINLTSVPGEAPVNFKTQAMILPPAVVAAAYTSTAATDLMTWTPGAVTLISATAIQLNTNSSTGISTGVVYYVGNISGSTFQLFTNPTDAALNSSPVNITSNGSGTFSTFQLAKPTHKCTDQGQVLAARTNGIPCANSYIVDSRNQVWILISYTGISGAPFTAGQVMYMGNISTTIAQGDNSICVWNNYLFLFYYNKTDICDLSLSTAPASMWTYNWAGFSPSETPGSLRCLVAQDDAIYICNGDQVSSILEVAGEVFIPSDPTTYTVNVTALQLPVGEEATCLAELGTTLLVGGTGTSIYPWDRVSTSYNYPITVPERYISLIIGTNSNAYIFAGNRGRIYISNGANIDIFKKIPDYISGQVQPFLLTGGISNVNATPASGQTPMGDAFYWRNELYFTFIARSEAGNALLTTVVGVWAINLESEALRCVMKMSYDTYAGTIPVLLPDLQSFRPGGEGMFCGWVDASNVVGVDNSIRTPYVNFEARIETDMIPVGTYLDPFTGSQIEWKTSVPLGGGGTAETIRLSYRTNLSDSFTLIGTTTATGTSVVGSTTGTTTGSYAVSDYYAVNFQKVQWVQFLVESSSNATTPTLNRLTEIRIRDYPSGK